MESDQTSGATTKKDVNAASTTSSGQADEPSSAAEITTEVAEPVSISSRDESDLSQQAVTGGHVDVNLGFWDTGHYLLVSQWSDKASDRLQESLALNILKVLQPGASAERSIVQWPVFHNSRIPGNGPGDLREVLARKAAFYTGRSVILMGVLTDQDDTWRKACLGGLLAGYSVDFPLSLAQLSASPAKKRELWEKLKPFAGK